MSFERHFAASRALAATGDALRALDEAVQALARRPDDVPALLHAVDCARRAGRAAAALPWLERLCQLHPEHAPYRELLALLQAADAGATGTGGGTTR